MQGMKQIAWGALYIDLLGPKTKAQLQVGEMIGALPPPALRDHPLDKVVVSTVICR